MQMVAHNATTAVSAGTMDAGGISPLALRHNLMSPFLGSHLGATLSHSRSTPVASPVPSNRSGGTEDEEDSTASPTSDKTKIFPQISPGSQLQKYQCPLCHETLPSQNAFTAHIRGHNEVKPTNDPNDPTGQAKVYYCCLCGKMLSSFSSLDRHMLVHSGERPFSCQYCGQTFTTNGNMHRHKRTHAQHRDSRESASSGGSSGGAKQRTGRKRKGSLEQPQQQQPDFMRSQTAIVEKEGSSATKRMVPDQPDIFTMQMAADVLKMQMASAGGGGVKPCPLCQETFYNDMSLEQHVMTSHPGQQIQCDECPVKSNFSLLKLHKSIYHHKSMASFPSLSALNVLAASSAAAAAAAAAGANVDIPVMSKKEEPPKKLAVPKTKEEPILDLSPSKIPLTLPRPVLYKPPADAFSPKLTPLKHIPVEIAQSETDSVDHVDECDGLLREMKLKGEFPCRICPAVYPNLRALKGHNKEHMNKAPYECNVAICLYSSSDKCTLARHMRQHTGEKPFECKDCNFGFTTKANCERHVKNKHGKSSRTEIRESIVSHEVEEGSGDMSFDDSQNGSPTKPANKVAVVDTEGARRAQQKASLFAPYSASLFRKIANETPEEKASDTTTNSDGGSDAPLDLSRPVGGSNGIAKAKDNYEAQFRDDVLSSLAKPFGILPPAAPASVPSLNPMAGQMPLPFLFQHLAAASATNGGAPFDPTSYLLAYQDMMRRQQLQQQQSAAAAAAVKDPASFLLHLSNLQSNFSATSPVPAVKTPLNYQTPLVASMNKTNNTANSPTLLLKDSNSLASSSPSSLSSMETSEKLITSSTTPPSTTNREDSEADYKMVIKNGVLMKKQKQRRYRTERPHGCNYCNARFTLRSNMDRHVKQQHPESWNKFKAEAGFLRGSEPSERMDEGEGEEEPEDDDDEMMEEENLAVTKDMPEVKIEEKHEQVVDMDASSDGQSDQGYLDNEDEEFASGSEDGSGSVKKSAYSAAPNRIPCPHCARSFPWSSSLERHILTHTGEKPHKCDECPLWFTTKSNCDRHLIRKHGNNNNDKDANSPKPTHIPERPFKCPLCPSSTFSCEKKLRKHQFAKHNVNNDCGAATSNDDDDDQILNVVDDDAKKVEEEHNSSKGSTASSSSSSLLNDCPFKCHLCDDGFPDRKEALDHVKTTHAKEFNGWVARGAFDVAPIDEASLQKQQMQQQPENGCSGDMETFDQIRGKFPDYVNRKIVCLFCLRKFWSAEDLRRHVRSHTGDRPYTCDICQRKFSLKHSMLRHRKKHDSGVSSGGDDEEDDMSDSEENMRVSSPDEDDNSPSGGGNVLTLKKRANLMDKINKLSSAAGVKNDDEEKK